MKLNPLLDLILGGADRVLQGHDSVHHQRKLVVLAFHYYLRRALFRTWFAPGQDGADQGMQLALTPWTDAEALPWAIDTNVSRHDLKKVMTWCELPLALLRLDAPWSDESPLHLIRQLRDLDLQLPPLSLVTPLRRPALREHRRVMEDDDFPSLEERIKRTSRLYFKRARRLDRDQLGAASDRVASLFYFAACNPSISPKDLLLLGSDTDMDDYVTALPFIHNPAFPFLLLGEHAVQAAYLYEVLTVSFVVQILHHIQRLMAVLVYGCMLDTRDGSHDTRHRILAALCEDRRPWHQVVSTIEPPSENLIRVLDTDTATLTTALAFRVDEARHMLLYVMDSNLHRSPSATLDTDIHEYVQMAQRPIRLARYLGLDIDSIGLEVTNLLSSE